MSLPKQSNKKCSIGHCNDYGDWHHILPQHLGGNDHRDNLSSLCDTHHAKVHKMYELAYQEFQEYRDFDSACTALQIVGNNYGTLKKMFKENNAAGLKHMLRKHIARGRKEEDFNLEWYKNEVDGIESRIKVRKAEYIKAKKNIDHMELYINCLDIISAGFVAKNSPKVPINT